ncbi:hypothetical protein Ga0074812_12312 [Parafrankia irregularis]|uniref:Uncharacterized protein n=1 Tax=Parafrankia irregularis TaxID=795642 RepID=A0A0S4QUA4_9ACTN|nr:hypothetical protein Ga0074812_12312 [Parafrankia irregularis]
MAFVTWWKCGFRRTAAIVLDVPLFFPERFAAGGERCRPGGDAGGIRRALGGGIPRARLRVLQLRVLQLRVLQLRVIEASQAETPIVSNVISRVAGSTASTCQPSAKLLRISSWLIRRGPMSPGTWSLKHSM